MGCDVTSHMAFHSSLREYSLSKWRLLENIEPIKQIIYVCNVMRALFIDCELFIFESALEPIFLEAAQHLCP